MYKRKTAALNIRLATDERKTEYTKINRSVTNVEQNLVTDGQAFEGVPYFRCRTAG